MTSPSPTSFRMLRALRRQCVREVSTLLLFTSLLLQSATAVAPGWWDTQQLLTSGAVADDYTVANLGQLKSVAKKAAAEMNSALSGGAGNDINALIAEWEASPAEGVVRDDYAALTIGQLKNVVRLFYDRLAGAGVTPTGTYPWSGRNADDYALANLGQLKTVFSFEMDTGDANQNGIPDVWELQMFGNLNQIAGADFDQDGLTNFIEYQTGTDPSKIDTDGDGVSDGDEVAQGTDPAKPPPSWKWTQAQLAEAEAAYDIGLQEIKVGLNTDIEYTGGEPDDPTGETVEKTYRVYPDWDEEPVWVVGPYNKAANGSNNVPADKLATGATLVHDAVGGYSLPDWDWEPGDPVSNATALLASGTVEATALGSLGVATAKAEFRLVRRLKDGATAPEDLEGNLIKPEIKRTYLKVTTIVTDTGTTTTTAEVVVFTIPADVAEDEVSTSTSGVLFPDVTTAGTYRIDLLPVEVRDVSNNQVISDTAWIKGHRTDDSGEEPEMPKLEARILGLPSSTQVEWRLENQYPRRSGRDYLNIPPGPSEEHGIYLAGDQSWKIWEAIQSTSMPQFFGGDVKVKYRLYGLSTAGEGVISFKIRGENPDDARCKAHIIANQGSIWYAWAIAKHESGDSKGEYNQFANGLDNGGAGSHGAKGEPFYSPKEGDGWGLFQRDSASGIPVTTLETWSWDGNMKGFINDEYPEHLRIANNYVDSVKRNNPATFVEPQFNIKGHSISGRHVLALTWYNGPQGRSNSRLMHFNGSTWSHDLPNAPEKNQPYVHEIIDTYNGN